MPSDFEIIEAFLEELKVDTQAEIQKKGKVATGETIKSLKVKMDSHGGELLGAKFFRQRLDGRGPTRGGGGGGSGSLRDRVLVWIRAKGIGANAKEQESLSWAISKTIHEKGTKQFREGRSSGIIEAVINDRKLGNLRERIEQNQLLNIRSEIEREFRR